MEAAYRGLWLMPARANEVDRWIKRHLNHEQPRSKSLIVTAFGDTLASHTEGIWLADLFSLMAPFGINERLVRTSAFRLTEEGWLKPSREGRRSRYALTELGRRRFDHAYRRIYARPANDWDGLWTIVILLRSDNHAPDRVGLKRELEWEGFRILSPGILIRPAADLAALQEVLERLALSQRAIVTHAHAVPTTTFRSLADLATQLWNLDEVAAGYQRFLERFRPLATSIEGTVSDEHAFIAQTLLMHSYRRVSLHDPHLPTELLPNDWTGLAAYELCRDMYKRLHIAARKHIVTQLGASAIPAQPSKAFMSRFGGL